MSPVEALHRPRFVLGHEPRRVLVVVTRRIGDVLLTLPLVRSLKSAWPSARIDMLVFKGTEGVLAGNPDLDQVIVVPASQPAIESLRLVKRLRRRYDLALSTSPSDRPTLYAWLAGKSRIGVMASGAKHAWKRALLHATVPFDDLDTHTVVQNLWLADLLGLPRRPEILMTGSDEDERRVDGLFPGFRKARFAVLHLFPKFTYKMWDPVQWRELTAWLNDERVAIVLSGSSDPRELAYVNEFANLLGSHGGNPHPLNLAGQLSFAQLALLLQQAALYVGPDTVTTHLAAAVGAPTVALFGPSNPVKWGPWPQGSHADPSPYGFRGTQIVGNVALVQGAGHCVPCLLEGCARHEGSESVCLQMLSAGTVIEAARKLLAQSRVPA
ncbi:MAG TPA: glycosyltransferase family 9 protein [Burkholderiales bacterium]|nr:glycosyltransferase family 9 protein [Burkholderiales bacterium]